MRTNSIVAIKERKSDNEAFINAWRDEIMIFKYISEKLEELTTSRLISVLDDTTQHSKDKYIVMEWIDGGNLIAFNKKKMRNTPINQFTFLKLMVSVLKELEILHSFGIIHRDVHPENIMYVERNQKIFFFLIDFGISYKFGSLQSKTEARKPRYSPPEQNSRKESFKGDIFSFSVTLEYVLKYSKIKVGDEITSLISEMKNKEIDSRPSIQECLTKIEKYAISISLSQSEMKELFTRSCNSISSNFDLLRKHISFPSEASIQKRIFKVFKEIIPLHKTVVEGRIEEIHIFEKEEIFENKSPTISDLSSEDNLSFKLSNNDFSSPLPNKLVSHIDSSPNINSFDRSLDLSTTPLVPQQDNSKDKIIEMQNKQIQVLMEQIELIKKRLAK